MNIYGSSNSNGSDGDNSDNNSSRNDSQDYKVNFRGSFWNKKANNVNHKKQMNSESEGNDNNSSGQNSRNSSNISNANENELNNVHKEEMESVRKIEQISNGEEEVEEEEGSQEEESNEENEEHREEEVENEEEEDYNELNKNEEEYNNNEQIEFEEHRGDEEEEHNREEEENSIRETYEEKVPKQEMNEKENEILIENNEFVKEDNMNEYQINEEDDNDNYNNFDYNEHIHKKNDNDIIKNNSISNDDIFSLLSTDNEIQINQISNKYGTKKTLGLLDIVYILCECKLFREILKPKKITNINELKKEATKTQKNNSPTLKRKKLEFSFTEQLWIHLNPQNKDTINKHIFNNVMEILLSHSVYSQEEISEQLEQYLYSTYNNNNNKPINNIITFPLSNSNSLTNVWSIPILVENFISINDNWIINIPKTMLHTDKHQEEEGRRRNDIGFSFRNVCQCGNCNETQSQKNVIKINEIKGEYIRQFTFGKKDFQDIDVQKEDDLIEVEFTEPISKQLIKFQILRDTSPTFIVNDLSKKYLLDKHTKKSLAKLIKQVHNIYFNNDNHNDFNNGFYK